MMTKSDDWKLRPAELHLIAARAREAEPDRKMLALGELLEERDHERERFRTALQSRPSKPTGRAYIVTRLPMRHSGITLIAFSVTLAACSQASVPIGDSSQLVSGASVRPLTEEEARQDLADEGYGEVNDLRREADGSWMGTATLHGKETRVTITPDGFIFPR